MESKDIPIASLSSESTHIEISPVRPKESKMSVPEQPRRAPPTEIRKPATTSVPAASAPQDPRKASEFRRPAPTPAPAPAAPVDEDPENLLREYAERQKTKMARLESQLGDLRKATSERDAYKARAEQLGRELQEAKAKLEAAGKVDAVVKDLQAKVDAAILSNSMMTEENGKLKARVGELSAAAKKAEERAVLAEKSLVETSKHATSHQEARREAEARIAAALEALGIAAAPPAREKTPTGPVPKPSLESAPTPPPSPAPAAPSPLRIAQNRPGLHRR
jgi:hypothetical protein